MSGQSQLLRVSKVGYSAALSAMIGPIHKLIVRIGEIGLLATVIRVEV
jgi:hypothetical protein